MSLSHPPSHASNPLSAPVITLGSAGDSVAKPTPKAETGLMKTEPTALAAGLERSTSQPIGPEASVYGSQQRPFSSAQHETDPEQSLLSPERTMVWGIPFDRVTLDQAVGHIEQLVRRRQPSYVITANVNYVMLHHRHGEVRPITEGADLVLADGQPIVWRSKLGHHPLPERVAGSEMIYRLAEVASMNRWGIYFLGGQSGVAATCARRLAALYPGLRIAGVESPPYRTLTPEEQAAQYQRIRESAADLLLVALGQPKGERWIYDHHRQIGVPVSIQLGASFDFIAGTAKRAPQPLQRLGLEWAHRMVRDPRRLVPRYTSNACFLFGAMIEDWKRKVTSWGMGDWTSKSA